MQNWDVIFDQHMIVLEIFKTMQEWSNPNCLLQGHVDAAMHDCFTMNPMICVVLVERYHFHKSMLLKNYLKYSKTLQVKEDILGNILEVTIMFFHSLRSVFILMKMLLQPDVVYIVFVLKEQFITI